MKRFFLGSLSVLTIFVATMGAAKAQTAVESPTVSNNTADYSLSPVQLISMARQGHFKEQGIPGYSAFHSARQAGRVNAVLLVQSAVNANKLSEEALSDREYLNAVDTHLSRGGCGSM